MPIFSLTRQPVQPEQGILREDLNVISPGHAVIRKVIAGSNIEISYTGVDAGTGDVTISYVPSSSSPNPNVVLFNNTGSGNSSGASYNGSQSITVSYNTIGAQGQSPILTALTNLVYSGGTPFVKMTGANTFALDATVYLTANQNITLSGDVTGSGNVAISTTISNNAVTLSKLAQISTSRFLGRVSASVGNVEELTATQATSILNLFTDTLKGLVPASGGGTTNFLRADGTWAAPAGGGGGSSGTTTNSITFNNSGSGNTSGITFNGSSAVTVSFNTIGAQQSNAILTGLTSLTYVSGTPFVKMTGASSFSLDTNTYYLASNPSGYTNNTGTVTSVALSLPAIFGLTGSPITTSGTFTVTLASQTANTVFIAPNGSAGAPTFRALVLADLPSLSTTNVSEGTNLYYTDTRARAALSFVAGSGAYNSTTGVITIPTNTSQLTNGAGYIVASSSITGAAGRLTARDIRIIAPNNENASELRFGFTSWANNNTAPYADFLHLRSYTDSSGGNDNLVLFRKDAIGMRIYQQSFGSATAYSSFVDVWHSGNLTNLNQLTNGPGYITGYTETDTLASVTGRGASTSTNLTFNGTLSFGSVTRQMLNLWSTDYALGVQSSTLYFRSGSRFSWFRGGSHNDSENNPGGGTVAMTLDGSSNLTVGNAITAGGIVYLTYNTASGRTNMGFSTGNSVLGNIHIQNGSGPGNDNSNQAAITFQGSSSSQAQAGIYVLNNGSYGTSMGFAVTENYTTGPQLFMTSTNNGVVNFPRATPTVFGNAVLHAGNYNSYSPTLTGGGASGTWGISISGNAATVSDGMYLSPTQTVSGIKYFISNFGSTSTVGNSVNYRLQAYSSDAGAAGMSFHRGGLYAVNMGLDPDNVLRIGGWSASANRWELDMSGNNTIAGSFNALNGSVVSGSYGTNAHASSSPRVVGRIFAPRGAAYSDIPITGAIKIRLPFRANDSMWSMKVRIYNYAENQTLEYLLGNYSYSAGAYNWSATYLGGSASVAYTVRFGNDGTYDCVWIGETSTSWSYPVISVIDFTSGYVNGSVNNYLTNWDISIVTSFGTVGAVVEPNIRFNHVYAASVTTPSIIGSGGSYIQSTSTGVSYTQNWQIRENSGGSGNTNVIYAPQLAFHWGGVVASSILMESSGRLSIRNNPGTSYEKLIAGATTVVGYNDSIYLDVNYNNASTVFTVSANGTSVNPFGILDIYKGGTSKIQLNGNESSNSYINAGNVGIGTTSPSAKLQVVGAGLFGGNGAGSYGLAISNNDQSNVRLVIENTGSGGQAFSIIGGIASASNAGLSIYDNTNAATRLYISNTGGVGIGTTSPGYRLEVSGDQKITSGALGVNVNPNATDGRIDASNDIVAYSSDMRLKTNIQKISNPLEKIKSLTGFIYNWNDKANELAGFSTVVKHVGVYAQEVQAVLPEAVKLAPFDNNGYDNSISGQNYLTVQYEKIVPLLIEAIKEQQTIIEELKSKVYGITS